MKKRDMLIPAAWVVMMDGNDKVLLMRRANTGWRDGWWSLPSGHVDTGESSKHAAVREVEEETGVTVLPKDLRFTYSMHRPAEEGGPDRVDFFFETRQWVGDPEIMEPDKCNEMGWFPKNQLPDQTVELVQIALMHGETNEFYKEVGFQK